MRKSAGLLVGASFALLTIAACGAQTVATGSGGPSIAISNPGTPATPPAPTTTPVVTAPMTVPATGTATKPAVPPVLPVPKLPRVPVPPGQVHSGGMTTPPAGVQVTKDGKQVVFDVEQSGCQHITGQATSQTATSVAIQVVDTITSHGGQVCPMIVRQVPVTVALNAPLGNRTIVFSSVTKHS
ncbi:MAG TPA: hypothetical protein VGL80_00610 [Pseudonocardiaceae bacterium]|jgi:hypothetical protein